MTTATLGIAVTSNAGTAAVDLDKLTAAASRAETGVAHLTSASVKTAAATSQIGLNSANIAAQLQDIAVSAQMGMSPLQVALQQGTQLSAVLGGAGGGLRGTVTALGAAFASVLSPVSLLTIGIVALSTVGVQALASLVGQTKSVSETLKEHGEEVARLTAGYDEAESAVKDFIAQTQKLPRGSVQIELAAEFADMRDRVSEFLDEAQLLGPALSGSLNQTDREISALLTRFNEGSMSAEDLAVELTRIANTDLGPLSFSLDDMVNRLKEGATFAAAMQDAYISLQHITAGTGWNEGTAVGLRSSIEADRSATAHKLELDALKAVTPEQLADIARRRERLKLVDEEISEALREQKVREAGELAFAKANAKSGKAATKELDRWGNTVGDFQKRIDQVQAEIDLFGKGTEEIVKQKEAINLLNEAKQAGIPITDAVTAQIGTMASELAIATAELERMQREQERIDAINQTLASGFSNLFIGILDGSQTAAEGVANLAKQLGSLFINQAFQTLFSPTAQGGAGFDIGSIFSTLFGGKRASGGPVQAGKIYSVNENTPNTEYFAPATNGSILTPAQLAAAGGGGRSPVVINNYTGEPVETRESAGGGIEVLIGAVERRIKKNMGNGGYRQFGVAPGLRRT